MQLLMLELTRAAIADAGYEKRALPRERTSVILANAGHGPITALYSLRSMLGWLLADLPAAEREALAARLPEWTEDSFAGYLGNVTAGRGIQHAEMFPNDYRPRTKLDGEVWQLERSAILSDERLFIVEVYAAIVERVRHNDLRLAPYQMAGKRLVNQFTWAIANGFTAEVTA